VGVDVPELDDREYEELLEDAKKVIPAAADAWTDMNPHDPGVTIVELLAWLTESYVYQLDQVTDDHREKYLRLVGDRRRRPQSATVRLSLSPPGQPVEIPAGTRLEATDGDGSTRRFETDHDVVCTDADLAAVVTVDETGVTDNTEPNETEGMFFRAFGDGAHAGAAMCLGFDGDPFADSDTCSLTVAYHDDDLLDLGGEADDPETFVPSVDLVWEYCTDERRWDEADAWQRLPVLGDGTESLYRSGAISLGRPPGYEPTAEGDRGIGTHDSGLVWLRCRVVTPGYEIPPQLDWVRTNVVTASHRLTETDVTLERVDEGAGVPALDDQRFSFPDTPVRSATISVDGTLWTEVPDFDASGPDDRHYVLGAAAGEVRFGDGERGSVPPANATVVATSVVYGGGADGNVPESTVWNVANPERELGDGLRCADVSVASLGPATGGRDMESIEAAFRRVKRDRRVPYRAVTADDHAAIAARTPGLRIARTTVAVGTEDGQPAVTVVVVPYAPPDCSKPVPSEGFLDAVQRQLDARRLLTDRVTAVSPTYVGLTIDVEAQTRRTYTGVGQETAIRTALEEHLDPLRGGDGDGWPFGRGVSEAELADVLDALELVDKVQDVTVTAHGDATVAADGTITIPETALFYVGSITADLRVRERGQGGGRS
jgi:predicted phage baseplate assembly protein